MVALNGRHRPLVGGIRAMPLTGPGESGTLTCVARRNVDKKKVFVTNVHVSLNAAPAASEPMGAA